MAHGLKLNMQVSGGLTHFEVFKAPVLNFAGPMLNRRQLEIDQFNWTHHIHVDIGYPFRESGKVYAWQFYHANAGRVQIGDLVALVMRNVAGELTVIPDGVLPMTQDMDGEGIWEHSIAAGAGVDVLAEDLIGFYIPAAPSGPILPRWRYDGVPDETTGAYQIDLGAGTPAPIVGASYPIVAGTAGADEAELEKRRLPIQARGETPAADGTLTFVQCTDTVDAPYVQGNGPLLAIPAQTVGSSGAAPEYYVVNVVGSAPNNVGNMFNLDGGQLDGLQADDGESGDVVVRIANGDPAANARRVQHIILGVRSVETSPDSNGERCAIYVGDGDATDDDPATVTSWTKIFQWPDDSIGFQGSTGLSTLESHNHIHVFKKAKWVRLQYENNTGTANRGPVSFLIYPVDNAVPADDEFDPNFDDQHPEYFWTTDEGATFVLSTATAPGGGVTVLDVSTATTEDFAGMTIGDSIWSRINSTTVRHAISAFDAGAKTITLTGEHSYAAGVFFDSRILAFRVDGYNGTDKVQESAPILVRGMLQERSFKVHKESDITGMP